MASGGVRVNSTKIAKAAYAVGPGDVLTFAQARQIRVVRIVACGPRRGPAPEAQALYEDLSPPPAAPPSDAPRAPKFEGKGRPTKRDRRILDRNRDLGRSDSLE